MCRVGRLLCCLAVAVALAGCAAKTVTVKGKVHKGGTPLSVSKTGVVQVTLVPVDAKTSPSNRVGRAQPDGSFEIEQVPPGKYRVVVEQLDPNPMTDKLGGAFSALSTKIVRDVNGKTPLDVDLAKPEG